MIQGESTYLGHGLIFSLFFSLQENLNLPCASTFVVHFFQVHGKELLCRVFSQCMASTRVCSVFFDTRQIQGFVMCFFHTTNYFFCTDC
jgi:hypothetical protein